MTSYTSILDSEEEMATIGSNNTGSALQQNGEELQQIWHPAFVVFAYAIAFLSSYSAVHLLDHHLWFWRSEELRKSAILKHPDIYAACMLAVGTVWCMHFVSTEQTDRRATKPRTCSCNNRSFVSNSLAFLSILR